MSYVSEQFRAETSMGVYRSTSTSIPDVWEPAYLASKLKEFHLIEDRMPRLRGPKEFGTNWPGYAHSQKEINGYINRDCEPELVLALRRHSQADPYCEHLDSFKFTRVAPSTVETSLYELMLDYLTLFGAVARVTRDFLLRDARLVADGAGQQERCITAGRPLGTFKDMRRRALNAFCTYLNENNKRVL